MRTRLRTASLRTVPKVRFGQVQMQVSVETTLETCGWKHLRKSTLSLLQQALQPPAKCAFAVTMSINPSSKLKFSEVPKVRFRC